MLFDLSSTIIALRNQRLGFDQVRLDGPVDEPADRGVAGFVTPARPVEAVRRWRFDLLRARAA